MKRQYEYASKSIALNGQKSRIETSTRALFDFGILCGLSQHAAVALLRSLSLQRTSFCAVTNRSMTCPRLLQNVEEWRMPCMPSITCMLMHDKEFLHTLQVGIKTKFKKTLHVSQPCENRNEGAQDMTSGYSKHLWAWFELGDTWGFCFGSGILSCWIGVCSICVALPFDGRYMDELLWTSNKLKHHSSNLVKLWMLRVPHIIHYT